MSIWVYLRRDLSLLPVVQVLRRQYIHKDSEVKSASVPENAHRVDATHTSIGEVHRATLAHAFSWDQLGQAGCAPFEGEKLETPPLP